jgi:hypothetical protein
MPSERTPLSTAQAASRNRWATALAACIILVGALLFGGVSWRTATMLLSVILMLALSVDLLDQRAA